MEAYRTAALSAQPPLKLITFMKFLLCLRAESKLKTEAIAQTHTVKPTDVTLKPYTTPEPCSNFSICAKRDYPDFARTLARWKRLPSSWASTSVLYRTV